MLETLKDPRKLGATVATAGALALGLGATTAEAAPSASQDNVPEAVNPSHSESIDELTTESVGRLLDGKPINFYHGLVEIVDTNTHKQKAQIENPIIIYRTSPAKNLQFAAQHPRSKYWAIGYIQRDVEKGNLGNGNLVLLPFNNGGNNFVFHQGTSKVEADTPVVDTVGFVPLKGGGLNFNAPVDSQTTPLYDYEHQPLSVGQIVGPGGKGGDPTQIVP
jgi:hypothetical protein